MPVNRTPYGTWRVRWYDIDGRQQGRTFKTRKLAERFDAEVRADTGRGLPTARTPHTPQRTTSEAAAAWLESAHNIDDNTRRIYREALASILPVLGDIPVDRLDAAAINAYLNARRGLVAASSLHREYRTIRRLLRVSGRPDVVTRDTVPAPRVPDEEMRFLTAHELETLAAAIDPRYRTFVLVGGWGGLRYGELAGLRGPDVDPAGSRVHVVGQLSTDGKRWKAETKTKTRARRWVSLPESVTDELARDIAAKSFSGDVTRGAGYVWTQPRGGPLEHTKFRARYWVPATVAAGLATYTPASYLNVAGERIPAHYDGLRIHDLRHTAVALAISKGADPRDIQDMLGHASIQTTYDRYGHKFPGAQADLARRLDELRSTTRRLRAV